MVRLEALRLVDRHDLHGVAVTLEALDVALLCLRGEQPFDEGRAQMIYRSGQNMVLVMLRPGRSGAGRAYERPPVP